MLCAVYKSSKKADTFLYVNKKDDFSQVPETLLNMFGKPKFLMLIPVQKRKTIAGKPTVEFMAILDEQGFLLQLPPKTEDMLTKHRVERGLNEQPDVKFN